MLNPYTASQEALVQEYVARMRGKVTERALAGMRAVAEGMPVGQLRGLALIWQAQEGVAPAQRLQVIQDLQEAGKLRVVGKGRAARYYLA